MRRSAWTAVLAAGALVVAGCSSTSTTAGSSTAASSSAPSTQSSAASSATSKSSAASSAASQGGSASVAPATLDTQTTTWFTTLCGGVAPILTLASGLETTGQDNATAQQAGVTVLKEFGAALTQTGTALGSTPPPTFDGGSAFAAQMTSGLADSGNQISTLATSFAAIDPTDDAAFKQAASNLSGELTSAAAPLQAIGQLDPAVSAAAQQIPACQALGG